jgi:hypothetical protein
MQCLEGEEGRGLQGKGDERQDGKKKRKRRKNVSGRRERRRSVELLGSNAGRAVSVVEEGSVELMALCCFHLMPARLSLDSL